MPLTVPRNMTSTAAAHASSLTSMCGMSLMWSSVVVVCSDYSWYMLRVVITLMPCLTEACWTIAKLFATWRYLRAGVVSVTLQELTNHCMSERTWMYVVGSWKVDGCVSCTPALVFLQAFVFKDVFRSDWLLFHWYIFCVGSRNYHEVKANSRRWCISWQEVAVAELNKKKKKKAFSQQLFWVI